ncbi:hypothetical protein AB0M12_09895 [Nocardia vinacea]
MTYFCPMAVRRRKASPLFWDRAGRRGGRRRPVLYPMLQTG